MANSEEFIETLREEMEKFAKRRWKDFKKDAIEDMEDFLKDYKDDFIRWKKALDNGDLKKSDFEWLVQSTKDEAKLMALKKAGLAKVAQDRFVNGLIDLIIGTAFKTL